MTRYDRQPVEILIEVKARDQTIHDTHNTVNLSTGGLAFRSERKFAPGDMVEIRVPLVSPPFEVEARVCWCKVREHNYEIGVEFLNHDDAFMAHMVEQVCLIEKYKQDILRTEGRLLSPEDAATEWISKYAAGFPGSEDAQ
jgi:hypothetical protein